MAADHDGTVELLHRVYGAVEVARDMVERATGLYGGNRGNRVGFDLSILSGLVDAADALNALAAALSDELTCTSVGPAA